MVGQLLTPVFGPATLVTMTMDLWMWIALAAVVVLVLLAILFLVGKARRRQNTVSFEKKEDPKELTQEQKSGNYQATGGFNFASGPAATPAKEKEPELLPGQELGAEKESAPEKAATPPIPPKEERPAPPRPPAAPTEAPAEPEGEPEESAAPEVEEPAISQPDEETPEKVFPAGEPDEVETLAPAEEASPEEPAAPTEAPAEPEGEPAETEEPVEDEVAPEATPEPEEPARIAPSGEPEEAPETSEIPATADAPAEIIEDELVVDDSDAPQPDAVPEAFTDTAEVTVPEDIVDSDEPAAAAAPATQAEIDDIDEAEGRLSRLRGKLSRSQSAIGDSVLGILGAGDLDEDAWEEIEDTLLMADLGTASTVSVVEKLRERIAVRGVSSEEEARAMLREVLIEECRPEMDRSIRALPQDGKPAVVLVVGVNGTGKTTTTGKLARVLVAQNHKVLLGAADTFRAAAADQLETWGRRVGAETVRGAEGADPASVAFDAVAKGVDTGADVVLVDTAGRLHTSTGLMDQLGKVKRVVEKKAVVDEVILVLDATIGQNGLMQARTFGDVVDITGVALTKLDGTAKGGIVFQVQRELGVPVKLVGLGEGADHLAPFEPESFVDALLGEA